MFKSSSTSSIKQLWLFGISSGSNSSASTRNKSFKNLKHLNGFSVSIQQKRFKATALNITEPQNEDTKTNYVPNLDQRAKFGHTGKRVQEKISVEVS